MRKIAMSVAVALAALAGCSSNPDASPTSATSTAATTTTTSSPPTTTSKSGRPDNEDLFVRVLRDKGYVKTTVDETLVLAEGDLHCRSLRDGLTRQKILDAAGVPGSPARQKSEAVFFQAVVSLCPDQAAKATS